VIQRIFNSHNENIPHETIGHGDRPSGDVVARRDPESQTSTAGYTATRCCRQVFWMGSIVIAAPVLKRFKERQPQANLTLVTFSHNAELARMLGIFDETRTIRHYRVTRLLFDALFSLRRLRKAKPDLIIDLEYFSKLSTAFSACSGSRYRLGFLLPVWWRSRLLDGGIAFREDIHFCEILSRLLYPWGVEYGGAHRSTPLTVPESALREAEYLLAEILEKGGGIPRNIEAGDSGCGESITQVENARWIMVNPNAHDMCLERRWPRRHFAQLVEKLASERPHVCFGLLGIDSERNYTEGLRDEIVELVRRRVFVIAGRTTTPTLCGVLKLADLLITNDSGTMHLGAATGTSIVALFGPESPLRYGPLAPPDRCRVIDTDVVCGPCLSYMNRKSAPCFGRNICMQSLTVERVVAACNELMQ